MSDSTKGRTFDTLEVGERVTGRAVPITESHVVTFAGLTGDFNPLHMDAASAESTRFGQRIAHGLLTLVVGLGGLADRLAAWQVLAALGLDDTRFTAPVFFGDTIVPVGTIETLEPLDERRGVAKLAVVIENGEDVVARTSMKVLVSR